MIVYDAIFKKYGLSSTQQEILKIVGKNNIVLEIGSSTGYMTRAFLDNDCIVDVVEPDQKAVVKLPKEIRHVLNLSIEDNKVYSNLANYDFIIMADVLEHLVDPEQVLKKLHKIASLNTKLIISLPNIASWTMRKQLFFKGDFEYEESGLLDKTHLHFYTIKTLPKILSDNGWQIRRMIGTITRFPLEGLTGRIPMLYPWLVKKFKNLAYYHFLTVSSKKQ